METFKLFTRGIFSGQKAYLNRLRIQETEWRCQEIKELEIKHKLVHREEFKTRLNTAISKLKLVETSQAAKEIMFAKNRIFECWDKLNTLLAKLLADQKGSSNYLN